MAANSVLLSTITCFRKILCLIRTKKQPIRVLSSYPLHVLSSYPLRVLSSYPLRVLSSYPPRVLSSYPLRVLSSYPLRQSAPFRIRIRVLSLPVLKKAIRETTLHVCTLTRLCKWDMCNK